MIRLYIFNLFRRLLPLLLPLFMGAVVFTWGHQVATQKAAKQITGIELAHLQERESALRQYVAKVHDLTETAAQFAFAYQAERDAHAQDTITMQREIARVTRQYRTALDAPAHPLPQCIFTAGFVRLYNAAITAPEWDAGNHHAAGPDAEAEQADELATGLQQADILAHVTDYGRRCRDLESQVNALINVEEARGGHR